MERRLDWNIDGVGLPFGAAYGFRDGKELTP